MKNILIPWQLFRQSLVLRTADNLESWLSRWCYGDQGAILIGPAVSVHEQPKNLAMDPDQALPKPHPSPGRAAGHPTPIILPVDRRLIDCFDEL